MIMCLVGVQALLAQPRDLFAEFEAEAAQPQSSSAVTSSSEAALSSSAVVSSSSMVVSSSSVAAPSSSETPIGGASDTTAGAAVDSVARDSVAADSTVKPDSSVVVDSVQADSVTVDSAGIQSSSSVAVSSSSVDLAQSVIPSSSSMSRRDLLGPVKVSRVHGIDDIKGQYKSPRKALFMSLVVPGSGQIYVGGSTFTYARGAVYLALEAALWGSWYYFSIHKYDQQVDKYKKLAKEHYSIGRYEQKMRGLYMQAADVTEESNFELRYMNSRESFCEALYGNAKAYGCYTAKGSLFIDDKAHQNHFNVNGIPENLEKEIGNKSFYDASTVYQLIADRSYVLGWDDAEEPAYSILDLSDNNAETVPLAESDMQKKYRSLRSKANDYSDMQAWFFGGLILNHIVSAVDAAFTAHSHNKLLYEEDLSWYHRMKLDSYVSVFDGLDVGVRASWGF
ncbi:MAG: hypothetical protein HUK21_03260 [Fibrobacteraceae bacterium]|nr:hypothetical protein [Fibrobacteraceae bacterium]